MNDLVSVITPCYNAKRFIEQCINSVIDQSYKNWEMIICDDCSSDDSKQIIQKYISIDKRIKLIQLTKNKGVANARNEAIKSAKGRYIAFLDSDDVWISEKLQKQLDFMQKNNLSFTYSSYDLIDEEGRFIGNFDIKGEITYKSMLKTCSVGCLSAIYDTKILGKLYMQNQGHEDYVLWLRIMKKINTTKGLNESLAKYRISKKSLSSNKFKSASWQWKIYRKIEKLNIFLSLYYFAHYVYNGFIKYKSKGIK